MLKNINTLEIIVNTLLQVGSRVIEVSKSGVFTQIWENEDVQFYIRKEDYLGKNITDFRTDLTILQCEEKIIDTFKTGKNNYVEYVNINNQFANNYGIRILNCHPDKNFLFLVLELLKQPETIHKIEDKWRLALDAASDGMWDMNLETSAIYCSRKWFDIFGYEPNEITTYEQWLAHVYADDIPGIIRNRTEHFLGATEIYTNEFRYQCKDGSYKWVHSRAVMIEKSLTGKPLRFIGVHRDITLIKKAELKHIETEQFLINLLNTLHDGILVTDENQNIIFSNQNFLKKYENDPDKTLIGKSIWDRLEFSKHQHKDPELFMENVRKIVSKREKVLDEELELKDGRTMKRDFLPIFVNDRFIGEIWQFRDITQQKNVEQRFAKQRTFYEHILNSLTLTISVFDADFRYIYINKRAINDDDVRNWAIGKTMLDYNELKKRPKELVSKRIEQLEKVLNEKNLVEYEEHIVNPETSKNEYYLIRLLPVYDNNNNFEFVIGFGIDITDLVIAREELKVSIDTFSSAFEHSGIGMALLSPEGNWLNVNKMVCEITGYNKEELLQLTIQDITYPEDLEGDINLVNQILNKQIDTYTLEKRYITKENKIVWILLTVSIVWNTDGSPKFFISQIMDITKKKQLETELETQHRFYENILNNIPADIAVFAPDHRYLFVNKTAFKNDELRKWMIGKTDIDYAQYSNRPESFYTIRFELYERAERERKEVNMIEKMINKEGVVSYHLRYLRPIFNEKDQFELIVAYGANVTELILIQEALKTSTDTFANAFHNSGIGMALISTNGQWLDVNKVLCDISGYDKEALMQLNFNDITHPEDKNIDSALTKKLFLKIINTYTIEKRYITKTNKIILASLTVSLVWNSDGTPKFFIAQIIDITVRKQLEIDLERKNVDLEATRVSLVNKISQLEDLNKIIAHNLRGPANNIKMLTGTLLKKLKDGIVDDNNAIDEIFTTEEALNFLTDSSNSLINSLETLLEITHIQLNQKIAFNNCDVTQIITDICKQLQGTIYEKHAVIIQQLELKHIQYPKIYLESILYNLISNALKYSKKEINPEVIITTQQIDGNRVKLTVKDNGLGINMAKYGNKVFKLNQVFHVGYDSKGVGLYITKTQIESLGGTIEVQSKVNEGSEFIIIF